MLERLFNIGSMDVDFIEGLLDDIENLGIEEDLYYIDIDFKLNSDFTNMIIFELMDIIIRDFLHNFNMYIE